MRREKREKDEARRLQQEDQTELTSLSQEDLRNSEEIEETTMTKKLMNTNTENHTQKPIASSTEDISSLDGSRRSSNAADDTRVLIRPSKSKKVPKDDVSNMKLDHVNLMSRMIKMKDNVRQRFKSKAKQEPQEDSIENAMFKIMPAEDWQEADHKSVKLMADTIQEGDVDDAKQREWKEVGKVLNYSMMWLYIFSLILTFFVLIGPILTGEIPNNSL